MNTSRSVELTSELAAAAATAAEWRGMSLQQYVREVVGRAAHLDAKLAADIKQGEDDLAAGRFYTQEEVEAMFDVRRGPRRAA